MKFDAKHKEKIWRWKEGEQQNFDYSISSSWPRLSIITPSYNQGQYIEETIRSILLQGYPNLEYIIIDGGSTDNSVEIIKKYETHLAYWISEPDHGQSHAINKGIAKATGDWIAWLNADDIYLPNALGQAMQITFKNSSANWIVGITLMLDQRLRKIGEFRPDHNTGAWRVTNYPPSSWLDFVCTKQSGTGLPQPSSFWRKTAWDNSGGIDENLRYAMDHDLYGRLAYLGYVPYILNIPLAGFRLHSQQKTNQWPNVFWQEELKSVDKWLSRPLSANELNTLQQYRDWLQTHIDQTDKSSSSTTSVLSKIKKGVSRVISYFKF